jgi:hypothetical protein
MPSMSNYELWVQLIEAFAGPPQVSNFPDYPGFDGELRESLVHAVLSGATTPQTFQMNNSSVDASVQMNEILSGNGYPIVCNQQGAVYVDSPVIIPPGLGIDVPFQPAKNGGPFFVPGFGIYSGPNWDPTISTYYQDLYGLPPSVDAPVIMPGVGGWLRGVVVSGTLNPSSGTAHRTMCVALYNTDLTLDRCLIRNATSAGAAVMDVAELGVSHGTAYSPIALPNLLATTAGTAPVFPAGAGTGIQYVAATGGNPPMMLLNFASPLGAYMGIPPSNTANAWGLNMTGVTGVGHAIPPNPINIFNDTTGVAQITIELSNSTTGLTIGASPSATVQFIGAARYSSYATCYESDIGYALDLSGVDTKLEGGRKQNGLAIFNCQGLDCRDVHFTGVGGAAGGAFGNTGSWNVVIAARGTMANCIFDTVPAGSSGLIGYMNNDPSGDPFTWGGSSEYHMNNTGVTNVPIINRIVSGPGQQGTSPLQIGSGASCYAATGSSFESPTTPTLGGLIDNPLPGDEVHMYSLSTVWFIPGGGATVPNVSSFFGTAQPPNIFDVNLIDVPIIMTNKTSVISAAVILVATAGSPNSATIFTSQSITQVTNATPATTLDITMSIFNPVPQAWQRSAILIYDSTSASQTLTFFNTENSAVSVPASTSGNVTHPTYVEFVYNPHTTNWRCIKVS